MIPHKLQFGSEHAETYTPSFSDTDKVPVEFDNKQENPERKNVEVYIFVDVFCWDLN